MPIVDCTECPGDGHSECDTCNSTGVVEVPALAYVWTVEIEVAARWVADGIDLSNPRQLQRLTEAAFPFARMSEVSARLVSEPDADAVAREQGYLNAADKKARTR